MWFLKPKRTLESVVREFAQGLEEGTLYLREADLHSERPVEVAHQQLILIDGPGLFQDFVFVPSAEEPTTSAGRTNGTGTRTRRPLVDTEHPRETVLRRSSV
jgi:hypothetical protein